MGPSIWSTNEIYACSETAEILSHQVSCPALIEFSQALYSLERAVEFEEEDTFWAWFVRSLRRFRFNICASLLPFHHQECHDREQALTQSREVDLRSGAFPTLGRIAKTVLARRDFLLEIDSNPLWDMIVKLPPGKTTAVLLKESRFVHPVEQMFEERDLYATVVTPSQLRTYLHFDSLIIIGAPRWFPSYIFDSPRAREVEVVSFAGIGLDWQWSPVLEGSACNSILARRRIHLGIRMECPEVSAEDIYPVVPLETIAKEARDTDGRTTSGTVKARLVLLEGGDAVFLNGEDEARTFVINLDSDNEADVEKIYVNSLSPGAFILLRTSGGGDYIAHFADSLMGEQASVARELQAHWKNELSTLVEMFGEELVLSDLRSAGSTKANSINLKNWLLSESIRPQSDVDFAAILEVSGLMSNWELYQKSMDGLLNAHRSAGRLIRQRLIEEVESQDLSELQRVGTMNFELPEDDGGSLTAWRVTEILPSHVDVSASRLNQPFQWERQPWLD